MEMLNASLPETLLQDSGTRFKELRTEITLIRQIRVGLGGNKLRVTLVGNPFVCSKAV